MMVGFKLCQENLRESWFLEVYQRFLKETINGCQALLKSSLATTGGCIRAQGATLKAKPSHFDLEHIPSIYHY